MKKERKSATGVIRKHLKRGRSINQLQCLEMTGTWRLSSIIHNLRQAGENIISKPKQVKTRYGITTTIVNYKIEK